MTLNWLGQNQQFAFEYFPADIELQTGSIYGAVILLSNVPCAQAGVILATLSGQLKTAGWTEVYVSAAPPTGVPWPSGSVESTPADPAASSCKIFLRGRWPGPPMTLPRTSLETAGNMQVLEAWREDVIELPEPPVTEEEQPPLAEEQPPPISTPTPTTKKESSMGLLLLGGAVVVLGGIVLASMAAR